MVLLASSILFGKSVSAKINTLSLTEIAMPEAAAKEYSGLRYEQPRNDGRKQNVWYILVIMM